MKEDEHCAEKEQDKSTPAPRVIRKRNDIIYMKILVPSCAVGAIIGKGGESIVQAQEDTTALIKLSKSHDLYPGTLERVCLIQGTREAVTSMHNYIMDRMLEKPDCPSPHCHPPATGHMGLRSFAQRQHHQQQQGEGCDIVHFGGGVGAWVGNSGGKLSWGRHKQVKILVPNCTAGLVIGKEGSYVKEIKEKTGAFIQISQKSQTISLVERCITIAGEPDQCRAAVDLVIAKIAEDPQSTSCPTISYSHVQGPVASAYPTGSPFAVSSTASAIGPSPSTAPASLVAAAAAAASQRYAAAGVPTGPPGDAFIPSGAAAMVQQPPFSPYPTALFHAALAAVQAGAGIDYHHQQQQVQPPRSCYPGYPATSAQPLPPQAALMFTSATTQPLTGSGGGTSSGGSASSVQSVAGAPSSAADLSAVYHASHQLMSAQWPTAAVGAGGHLPEVNMGYEAAGLPAPLNFAYYSANQPLLTSMPSRHHGDVFPASCLDPFSASTGYQQQHTGYHHQHLTQSTPIVAAGAPQIYTSSACFVQTNLTSDSGISCSTGGGPSFGPGGSGSCRPAEPTTPLAAYSLTGAATSPAAQQQQQLADYLSAVHFLGGGATGTYAAGQVARSAGDQLTTDFNPPTLSASALTTAPHPASGQQQQIPPPVTVSCGPSFALQPAAGFAMPHQFQFQTAAAAGWYPSAMSTSFALDQRSIPANIVDAHVVVSQQQQQQQPPPQEPRQQQVFTSGKLMTASSAEPIASGSSTLGCSSSRSCEADGATDGDAASTGQQLTVAGGDDYVLGALEVDQRSTAASPMGHAPSHDKGTAVDCGGPRSTVEQTPPGSISRGHQPASTIEQQQQPVCPPAPSKAVLSNGDNGHHRQPLVVGTGASSGGGGTANTSEVVSTEVVGGGSGEDSPKAVALNGVSG